MLLVYTNTKLYWMDFFM